LKKRREAPKHGPSDNGLGLFSGELKTVKRDHLCVASPGNLRVIRETHLCLLSHQDSVQIYRTSKGISLIPYQNVRDKCSMKEVANKYILELRLINCGLG